ncbi:ras-related protein Rab-42 isoform X2 [Physeter macrocephalus]|uniref:Ras-related protein Rab-42 isoform X2 n=1 Tax=Physeter macrocephalus TaxID=9755 RepID=A0A9W2WJI1_PHYMC|nr:ras-related protein Rab-42 isoform X2 [Physeter catodon]
MEAGGCRYQFRIALLGDAAVGKTSLLLRYVAGAPGIPEPEPELESVPTVGVEFYSRTLQLRAGPRVKLQLWDTAGQERFSFPGQEYRSAKLRLVWEMSSWSCGWWWGFGCLVLKKKKKSPSPWRKKEKTELLPSHNPGRLWKNQPEGPAHPGQGPPRKRCCPLSPAASLEECSADCSHTSLSASVSHL